MNNATAAILAFLLVAVFGADILFNETQVLTFIGKRIVDLITWMAFWR